MISPTKAPLWTQWALWLPVVIIAVGGVLLRQSARAQIELDRRAEAEAWLTIAWQAWVGDQKDTPTRSGRPLGYVLRRSEPTPGAEGASEAVWADFVRAREAKDTAAMRLQHTLVKDRGRLTLGGLPMAPLISYSLSEACTEREKMAWRTVAAEEAVGEPSALSERLIEALGVGEPYRSEARDITQHLQAIQELAALSASPGASWQEVDGTDWLVLSSEVSDSEPSPRRAISEAALRQHWQEVTVPVMSAMPSEFTLTATAAQRALHEVPSAALKLLAERHEGWRHLTLTETSPAAWQRRVAVGLRPYTWGTAICTALAALTAWLTQRTLRRQQALNQLQRDFVASVSHELRTPVASIGLLAERLRSAETSSEQLADYHDLIAREGQRLSALVANVLDFSRIERGTQRYDREPSDLAALVRETVRFLRPLAEENGLRLELAAPDSLEAEIDALAIRQAVINLLDNAIKFSPPGGRISISLSAQGPDSTASTASTERLVRLEITDEGPGIPPAERERIFQRFYRVDHGPSRASSGAGIGLSVVRHIVDGHGGRVFVSSGDPGHTCFILTLP